MAVKGEAVGVDEGAGDNAQQRTKVKSTHNFVKLACGY